MAEQSETQDRQPGLQSEMKQQPVSEHPAHTPSGKLIGRAAVVTGGDSGIGRAVAVAFAKEGADIAILYLDEHEDAAETERLVKAEGRKCMVISGDIGDESFCNVAMRSVFEELGNVNILVNNAGEQHPQENFADITAEQLERTFRTNIFSMFYVTKAVLPHMGEGDSIVNCASVTAYKGNPMLVDYSATKGAIVSFTRALSQQVADKGIRVNAVAPGPIWTPLIPSTFPKEKVESFGKNVPLKRAGQPAEVAMAFLFLASDDASYITGQTIHVNGGSVVNA
jgi:NAD(P)-dependent dehydrogenase (short-subunit alcohol dehydrogenase family)